MHVTTARKLTHAVAGAVAFALLGAASCPPGKPTTPVGDPLANCPQVNPPAGYSFFNQPQCPLQNVYNDPAPELRCAPDEYYCCAKSIGGTGGKGGRCGADHVEFPPNCQFGNPKVMQTASGCYIQN